MKIILTEDQYEQLTEMIKLDIKVGDTIMGGKFKNKKVVVKTIGKNDKGEISGISGVCYVTLNKRS